MITCVRCSNIITIEDIEAGLCRFVGTQAIYNGVRGYDVEKDRWLCPNCARQRLYNLAASHQLFLLNVKRDKK
jgi:hypothetical protein